MTKLVKEFFSLNFLGCFCSVYTNIFVLFEINPNERIYLISMGSDLFIINVPCMFLKSKDLVFPSIFRLFSLGFASPALNPSLITVIVLLYFNFFLSRKFEKDGDFFSSLDFTSTEKNINRGCLHIVE